MVMKHSWETSAAAAICSRNAKEALLHHDRVKRLNGGGNEISRLRAISLRPLRERRLKDIADFSSACLEWFGPLNNSIDRTGIFLLVN